MLTLDQATALSLSRQMDCEPVYVLRQGVDIFLISIAPASDAYPQAKVCAEICARFTSSDSKVRSPDGFLSIDTRREQLNREGR